MDHTTQTKRLSNNLQEDDKRQPLLHETLSKCSTQKTLTSQIGRNWYDWSESEKDQLVSFLMEQKQFNKNYQRELSIDRIKRCLQEIEYCHYSKDEFIFHSYESCDYLYILMDGQVSKLTKKEIEQIELEKDILIQLQHYQSLLQQKISNSYYGNSTSSSKRISQPNLLDNNSSCSNEKIDLYREKIKSLNQQLEQDERFSLSRRVKQIFSRSSFASCQNQTYYFDGSFPHICLLKNKEQLISGSIIGEYTGDELRDYSIVTDSDCQFYKLKMSTYTDIFKNEIELKINLKDFLRRQGINQIYQRDLEQISYYIERIKVKRDQIIYKQDDRVKQFIYFVEKGSFELRYQFNRSIIEESPSTELQETIEQPDPNQRMKENKQIQETSNKYNVYSNEEYKLFQVGPGEVFGNEELNHYIRNITVVSKEYNGVIYKIKMKRIKELSDKRILYAILNHGQNRLERINKRIQELKAFEINMKLFNQTSNNQSASNSQSYSQFQSNILQQTQLFSQQQCLNSSFNSQKSIPRSPAASALSSSFCSSPQNIVEKISGLNRYSSLSSKQFYTQHQLTPESTQKQMLTKKQKSQSESRKIASSKSFTATEELDGHQFSEQNTARRMKSISLIRSSRFVKQGSCYSKKTSKQNQRYQQNNSDSTNYNPISKDINLNIIQQQKQADSSIESKNNYKEIITQSNNTAFENPCSYNANVNINPYFQQSTSCISPISGNISSSRISNIHSTSRLNERNDSAFLNEVTMPSEMQKEQNTKKNEYQIIIQQISPKKNSPKHLLIQSNQHSLAPPTATSTNFSSPCNTSNTTATPTATTSGNANATKSCKSIEIKIQQKIVENNKLKDVMNPCQFFHKRHSFSQTQQSLKLQREKRLKGQSGYSLSLNNSKKQITNFNTATTTTNTKTNVSLTKETINNSMNQNHQETISSNTNTLHQSVKYSKILKQRIRNFLDAQSSKVSKERENIGTSKSQIEKEHLSLQQSYQMSQNWFKQKNVNNYSYFKLQEINNIRYNRQNSVKQQQRPHSSCGIESFNSLPEESNIPTLSYINEELLANEQYNKQRANSSSQISNSCISLTANNSPTSRKVVNSSSNRMTLFQFQYTSPLKKGRSFSINSYKQPQEEKNMIHSYQTQLLSKNSPTPITPSLITNQHSMESSSSPQKQIKGSINSTILQNSNESEQKQKIFSPQPQRDNKYIHLLQDIIKNKTLSSSGINQNLIGDQRLKCEDQQIDNSIMKTTWTGSESRKNINFSNKYENKAMKSNQTTNSDNKDSNKNDTLEPQEQIMSELFGFKCNMNSYLPKYKMQSGFYAGKYNHNNSVVTPPTPQNSSSNKFEKLKTSSNLSNYCLDKSSSPMKNRRNPLRNSNNKPLSNQSLDYSNIFAKGLTQIPTDQTKINPQTHILASDIVPQTITITPMQQNNLQPTEDSHKKFKTDPLQKRIKIVNQHLKTTTIKEQLLQQQSSFITNSSHFKQSQN